MPKLMSIEESQYPQLKAGILALTDPLIIEYVATRNDHALTLALNSKTTPTIKAWIIDQPVTDTDDAANYATFDGLSAGKRDSWAIFLQNPRDFSRLKVRQWVVDVWGAATAGSISETILQTATRNVSVYELIFGHTPSTTGTVTASKLNMYGPVDSVDVSSALNLL